MAPQLGRPRLSDLAWAGGLLLLALVTRLYGIAEWPLISDEYFSFSGAFERAFSAKWNQANYVLIVLCYQLFGTSEWTARLPSLIFGTLTVPVLALTWTRVLGRNTALLAAVLTVLSSWHLWYSQFARFYAAIFFLGVLAYYFFYRAVRSGSLPALAATIVFSLIGVSFHLTFVLVPASCAAFCIALLLLSKKPHAYSRRIALIYLGLHLAAALAVSPFLIYILGSWSDTSSGWGYGPLGLVLQTVKYVQLPIAITAALGLLHLWRQDRWKGAFFACGIGVPMSAVVVASGFVSVRPDYVFYTYPLILLLSADLCVRAARQAKSFGWMAHSLTLVVLASLAPEFVSHYTAKKSLDFRDAVSFVESRYEAGDRIISFPKGFRRYGSRGLETEPFPGSSYRTDIDWTKKLATYAETEERLWLILEVSRNSLPADLRRWLGQHSRLVWRDYEKRFDYSVRGYEIYLKERRHLDARSEDAPVVDRQSFVKSGASPGAAAPPTK